MSLSLIPAKGRSQDISLLPKAPTMGNPAITILRLNLRTSQTPLMVVPKGWANMRSAWKPLPTTTICKKWGLLVHTPLKGDTVSYPSMFKAPTLNSFDGKRSPNQHVYYFKSQKGNVIASDAILT